MSKCKSLCTVASFICLVCLSGFNAAEDKETQKLYNESAGKYRLQADAERPNDSGTMTIYPDKKIEWIIEGKSPESMSGKFTLLPGTATEGIFKGTLKLRIDGEGYLFSPAYAYFTYTWFGWDSSLPSDTLYLSRYDDGSGTFYGWVKH